MRFHTESRSDVLWVPKTSSAKDDRAWVTDVFGISDGFCQLLGTTAPGQPQFQDNVLQLATTWELFRLHEKVLAINVTDGDHQTYNDDTLCLKDTATNACVQAGYLNLWNGNFNSYLAAVSGSATDPTAGNITALYQGVNQLRYPSGGSVSVLGVFGGISVSDAPVRIIASEAVSMAYVIRKDAPSAVQDAWYNQFLDIMEANAPTLKYTKISYISGNSIDKEVSRSITKDFPLIAAAVLVFIATAVIGLSKWNVVHTRSSLGLVGLLLAALGMVAGYGLAMAIGLPFTSLQQTLPFVLLGLAVDVMFILVKSFEELEQDPDAAFMSLPDIFEKLLAGAGLSVMVTSLASMVAFALGTLVSLPSITWFSAYAVLSVLCICIMQLTGFVAVFYLNQRRIRAGRMDCCCCITRPGAAHPTNQPPLAHVASRTTAPTATVIDVHAAGSAAATDTKGVDRVPAAAAAPKPASLGKRVMDRYYAPWLLWWPTKVVVIAVFVAYAVVSGVGTTKLRVGQPVEDVAPDDSYLKPFFSLTKATFDQQIGGTTNLYFRHTDPSSPAKQAKIHAAINMTLSNPTINATISALQGNYLLQFTYWVQLTGAATLDSTAGCFNPYQANPRVNDTSTVYSTLLPALPPLAGCVPQDQFYPLLQQWLALPGNAYYAGNLVRSADGTITDSYFTLVHTAPADNDRYSIEVWNAKEDTTNAVNSQLFAAENQGASADVFMMYTNQYIFDQGDKELAHMTGEYAGLAVAGVTFVMLILLVHPVAALQMGGAVALVLLYLFGVMWMLNIRFNQVSVVNMVMATGLAVDYSVYLAQKFMTTDGASRDERVKLVLSEVGIAIFLGGLTALLGTIPLAFASSAILRTFMTLLFTTICCSLLVGMVLMPVMFSLVGPHALAPFNATEGKGSPLPKTVELAPPAEQAAK